MADPSALVAFREVQKLREADSKAWIADFLEPQAELRWLMYHHLDLRPPFTRQKLRQAWKYAGGELVPVKKKVGGRFEDEPDRDLRVTSLTSQMKDFSIEALVEMLRTKKIQVYKPQLKAFRSIPRLWTSPYRTTGTDLISLLSPYRPAESGRSAKVIEMTELDDNVTVVMRRHRFSHIDDDLDLLRSLSQKKALVEIYGTSDLKKVLEVRRRDPAYRDEVYQKSRIPRPAKTEFPRGSARRQLLRRMKKNREMVAGLKELDCIEREMFSDAAGLIIRSTLRVCPRSRDENRVAGDDCSDPSQCEWCRRYQLRHLQGNILTQELIDEAMDLISIEAGRAVRLAKTAGRLNRGDKSELYRAEYVAAGWVAVLGEPGYLRKPSQHLRQLFIRGRMTRLKNKLNSYANRMGTGLPHEDTNEDRSRKNWLAGKNETISDFGDDEEISSTEEALNLGQYITDPTGNPSRYLDASLSRNPERDLKIVELVILDRTQEQIADEIGLKSQGNVSTIIAAITGREEKRTAENRPKVPYAAIPDLSESTGVYPSTPVVAIGSTFPPISAGHVSVKAAASVRGRHVLAGPPDAYIRTTWTGLAAVPWAPAKARPLAVRMRPDWERFKYVRNLDLVEDWRPILRRRGDRSRPIVEPLRGFEFGIVLRDAYGLLDKGRGWRREGGFQRLCSEKPTPDIDIFTTTVQMFSASGHVYLKRTPRPESPCRSDRVAASFRTIFRESGELLLDPPIRTDITEPGFRGVGYKVAPGSVALNYDECIRSTQTLVKIDRSIRFVGGGRDPAAVEHLSVEAWRAANRPAGCTVEPLQLPLRRLGIPVPPGTDYTLPPLPFAVIPYVRDTTRPPLCERTGPVIESRRSTGTNDGSYERLARLAISWRGPAVPCFIFSYPEPTA